MKVKTTMANPRNGFKRIMGEIPEEMHEKITLYNKISDRPLNVSKAIELCMEYAIKKIESELITYAKESKDLFMIVSDKYYKILCKDIKARSLSPRLIHKHIIQMLKSDGFDKTEWDKHSVYGRIPLFPNDNVKLDKQTKHVIFYAKDVACFAVGPSCSEDDS
jgi:hypothetical protein